MIFRPEAPRWPPGAVVRVAVQLVEDICDEAAIPDTRVELDEQLVPEWGPYDIVENFPQLAEPEAEQKRLKDRPEVGHEPVELLRSDDPVSHHEDPARQSTDHAVTQIVSSLEVSLGWRGLF